MEKHNQTKGTTMRMRMRLGMGQKQANGMRYTQNLSEDQDETPRNQKKGPQSDERNIYKEKKREKSECVPRLGVYEMFKLRCISSAPYH